MHLIPCPWCGGRAETEFEYLHDQSVLERQWGSEAHGQFLERVYLRDHHVGVHTEIWQHVHGCRGWFKLERDNLTHEIHASEALGSSRPGGMS